MIVLITLWCVVRCGNLKIRSWLIGKCFGYIFYDNLRDSANHKFGVCLLAKILLFTKFTSTEFMRGRAKNILNRPSELSSNCCYVI